MNRVNKGISGQIVCVAVLMAVFTAFSGCQPDVPDTSVQHLFLSNTFAKTGDRQSVDARLHKLDYQPYELILHGGDITENTTAFPEVAPMLDSLWDIGSPDFLWALGNHDIHDRAFAEELVGHPYAHTRHYKGLTIVVLETQIDSSNVLGDQKRLLDSVLDTISKSSHLLVLQHKLTWLWGRPEMERMEKVSNVDFARNDWSTQPNNFHREVYPRLLEVEERGVSVICLGGDIGWRHKKFYYTSPEGIDFLAVGLNGSTDRAHEDRVLIFDHDTTNRTLKWRFQLLDELVAQQSK